MKLRIAGVPEHFNLPWHYASEKGYFSEAALEIEWIDASGGTGAMITMLENRQIDVALLLTEGALTNKAFGSAYTVESQYVNSPLVWGIHVAGNSDCIHIDEVKHLRYAVSRLGSGSHLMPKVWAKTQNFALQESQFVVVNHLQGAIEALTNGTAEVFFWEKFTTRPYVEKGVFKPIGEFPTPWPCFVAAFSTQLNSETHNAGRQALSIALQAAAELKFNKSFTVERLVQQYQLTLPQAVEWLNSVEWAKEVKFENALANEVSKYFK